MLGANNFIYEKNLEIMQRYKEIEFVNYNMPVNPLASPSAGAPALKYGDVNTVTPSPGEVKGLIILELILNRNIILCIKYLIFL